MFAFNQSAGSGSLPVSSDLWKIMLRAGAMLSAQVFNTVLGMPSGPGALKGFSCFSSLATPAVEIMMLSMELVLVGGGLGRWLPVVFVKTD